MSNISVWIWRSWSLSTTIRLCVRLSTIRRWWRKRRWWTTRSNILTSITTGVKAWAIYDSTSVENSPASTAAKDTTNYGSINDANSNSKKSRTESKFCRCCNSYWFVNLFRRSVNTSACSRNVGPRSISVRCITSNISEKFKVDLVTISANTCNIWCWGDWNQWSACIVCNNSIERLVRFMRAWWWLIRHEVGVCRNRTCRIDENNIRIRCWDLDLRLGWRSRFTIRHI